MSADCSGFADHFSGHAADYACFRPRYPQVLFDWLAQSAPANAVAWDCAAGSGQATVALAARFRRVIATDASAEQLARAPVLPGVEYRVATAEASGLPDGSVDLITVAQAAHWFDLDRFYCEARRVAAADCVVALWTYSGCEIGEPLGSIVRRYHSHTVAPDWPDQRALVDTGYATLPFPFPALRAPRFEMLERWDLDQLTGYLGTWSATQRYRRRTGTDPLPELREELARMWGDPCLPRPIRWPLHLRVGRVD